MTESSERKRRKSDDFTIEDPIDVADSLRRGLVRAVEEAAREISRVTSGRKPAPYPPIDVIEDEDRVRVLADVPGLGEDDIEVTMEGSALILSGERRPSDEDEEDEDSTSRREGFRGPFRRKIALPGDVLRDGIEATLRNGVLTVIVPRKPPAPKIQIKVSGGKKSKSKD